MNQKFLSVDIGGTFIKMAIIDQDAKFYVSNKVATVNNFPDLITILKKEIKDYQISAIAFSLPGSISDNEGTVRGINAVPFIIEGNFKNIIQKAFPGMTISMENDANCAILGEIWKGGFTKKHILVSLVVGTGIGGAIAINGNLLKGANNLTGEFGYAIFNDKKEILSLTSSTKAMLDKYNQLFKTDFKTGSEFLNDYQNHSKKALQPFLDHCLAPLINTIFNIKYFLNPDYIVIGGGISNDIQYLNIIKEQARLKVAQIPEYDKVPNIIASKLGNKANLLGSLYFLLNKKSDN